MSIFMVAAGKNELQTFLEYRIEEAEAFGKSLNWFANNGFLNASRLPIPHRLAVHIHTYRMALDAFNKHGSAEKLSTQIEEWLAEPQGHGFVMPIVFRDIKSFIAEGTGLYDSIVDIFEVCEQENKTNAERDIELTNREAEQRRQKETAREEEHRKRWQTEQLERLGLDFLKPTIASEVKEE
jgi:hypothetical protein